MTTLTIDRVALRDVGQVGSRARKRALDRLGRIDPVAPGPAAEVLILRQVMDPLPGALAWDAGRDGPAAWERALKVRVGRARDDAVRPALGQPATAADAVVFADEAEMIACLARDLALGRQRPWWGRAALRRLPRGAGAAVLMAQQPHLMPAIAASLLAQGAAEAVAAALPETDLAMLAEAAGLPDGSLAETDQRAGAIGSATWPAQPPTVALPMPPPSLSAAMQRLPPAPATLLAALWLRHLRPNLTGRPLRQAVNHLRADSFGFAQTAPRAPATTATVTTPRTPPVPPRAQPGEASTAKHDGQPPQPEAPSDAHTAAGSEPVQDHATANAPDARVKPPRSTPLAPDDETAEQYRTPLRLGSEGVPTAIGGVGFLVNLYVGAIPARAPALASSLLDAARGEDGPWTTLERLARALLACTPEAACIEGDALWQVLAALDGRQLDDAALPGERDHEVAASAAAWIAEAAFADSTAQGDVPSLLHRPARVTVSPAHVDLVFPTDAASLPIRRAGLDLDPGWQPRFGRVIAFHYRD